MNIFEKLKDVVLKRDSKKNFQDLTILFIIGLIIVIVFNFFSPQTNRIPGYVEVSEQPKQEGKKLNLSYEEKMEQELTSVLKKIHGVGEVEVMITFESGDEYVPAYNHNYSTKVTEESDSGGGKRVTNENNNSNTVVTSSEGGTTKPFVVKKMNPKVLGIIVVAEGAENPDVKYQLYEAVKTVFNLEQYRVNIYPMEKNN